MTNQELFDTVVAHARKQNRRALSPELVCYYRTPDGLKCFAGALIKDEYYQRKFEGLGADFAMIQEALLSSGVREDQLGLVSQLQQIHDKTLVPQWSEEFLRLAKAEGLIYADNLA